MGYCDIAKHIEKYEEATRFELEILDEEKPRQFKEVKKSGTEITGRPLNSPRPSINMRA